MRSIGVAIALIASIASCTAGMQLNAGVSVGGQGFAVMNGMPVVGGELRLVAPQTVTVDNEKRQVVGFPLQHTAVKARVGGMMAVYELEQTFENPFDDPIEAVYVFPLGADAAVSGYEIVIGERTIKGEIQTREAARATYEEAKQAGHTTALIEQNKANIFTQHIANIAPRERIRVKVRYTELLTYDNGAYTMAVPLTIGPRYLPKDRVGDSPVGSHAYGTQGRPSVTSIPYADSTVASSTVSFSAEFDAGVPVVGVESPSHDIVMTRLSPTRAAVELGRKGEIPNRDLIVKFKTAGPDTTIGLLAHRVDNDGYFMLALQPKAKYYTGDIRGREIVIVIDRSGSMDGQPLAQAKAVASSIINTIGENDSVNVIAFADGVSSMASSAVRGDSGKRAALRYVRGIESGGGTEMESGVISMLTSKPGSDRIRVVYFLTDGFVGNDDVVVGAANKYLGTNRIFTVGVGSAPNRALLDRLALAGRGFASYVTLTEDPNKAATQLVLKSAYPYLTDVEVDWGGLQVEDLTPVSIPDVYAGQPLVIAGRYHTPGVATIRVTATTAGRRVVIPIAVQLPAFNDFEPVASLWARRKIELLTANKELENVTKQITELGLQFHLVTDYTSFVAVDRSRTVSGQAQLVEQPSLIPEGVNAETTVAATSSSHHSHGDDGCHFFCGGGGGWGGGGPEDTDWYILAFAMLGALWLIVRRLV